MPTFKTEPLASEVAAVVLLVKYNWLNALYCEMNGKYIASYLTLLW